MKVRVTVWLLFLGLTGICLASDEKPKTSARPGTKPSQIGLQFPHNYNISPAERDRKNPVRFTDLSVDRGKKLFLDRCAMCHGSSGDGKGELAPVLDVHPPDFTKPETLEKRTDGELFAIIGRGSEKMPSHRTSLEEKQIWDTVNFLRALQGKIPEKSTVEDRKAAVHR